MAALLGSVTGQITHFMHGAVQFDLIAPYLRRSHVCSPAPTGCLRTAPSKAGRPFYHLSRHGPAGVTS